MSTNRYTSASRQGGQAGNSRRDDSYDSYDSNDDGSNVFESDEEPQPTSRGHKQQSSANAGPEKTIPKNLLTRVLHEFFEKDATRVSRDANAAVGKYIDTFVREAIARAAVEKRSGFLEVEDLEKIAPQLLLDL